MQKEEKIMEDNKRELKNEELEQVNGGENIPHSGQDENIPHSWQDENIPHDVPQSEDIERKRKR